ncbi:hypothetical protein CEXT_433001 [Caerostris extrusa]|uniref:Uncharacterized protein n=1 Tax=Caerostris extrusa TaxID=172846 RepID=A0AAV4SF54_CAEEX|nr:hypothetical protein CEXT_433001 [Caerostris extrusa]
MLQRNCQTALAGSGRAYESHVYSDVLHKLGCWPGSSPLLHKTDGWRLQDLDEKNEEKFLPRTLGSI